MDLDQLRASIPSLVASHLPRNARQYRYRTYDGLPQPSSYGLHLDPMPFQGTVIAKTDDALIVKTGRIAFAAIDRTLASVDPDPGTMIEAVPYARHDFAGNRIDAPDERHEEIDGHHFTVQTVRLGGRTVALPLPPPQCPELGDLIQQLETQLAPDGFRKIVHLLVDAGAHGFRSVDPAPEHIADVRPEIAFQVGTEKFVGEVAIFYDRSLDLYEVELRRGNLAVASVKHVDCTTLGKVLEDQIDDGRWRRIQITVLGRARPRRQH